jgi:hypothetical protein
MAAVQLTTAEPKMKTLKIATLVLVLAVSGCKESSDMMLAAHASTLPYEYEYSGVTIPNTAPRGQVFEYN